MFINNIVVSLIAGLSLHLYVEPTYSNDNREVVQVSEKRYVKPEHIIGLDTYNKPVNYYRREEYILRFKDRNGYFNVNKDLFNNTWLGRKFTVDDELLYFCRPRLDRCNSFEY